MTHLTRSILGLITAAASITLNAALVSLDSDGRLRFTAEENGNVIPDFSHCGFMAGELPIPEASVVATLMPQLSGDDGSRIQSAIDEVSHRRPNAAGLRGAILLRAGTYRVGNSLRISVDGVVLRGEGKRTRIIATGNRERTLIVIDSPRRNKGYTIAKREIADEIVPLGARLFRLESANGIRPGNRILVERRGNANWIKAIGMDRIPPRNKGGKPLHWGPFSISFDRVVTAVDTASGMIALDAPLGARIEKRWGGGSVSGWEQDDRLRFVGIEHLRLESEFNASITARNRGGKEYLADEKHCNLFIKFQNVIHSWAHHVTMANGNHGITLGRGSKWITVRDCQVESFVSQITGGRRYGFTMEGNLGLVMRCSVKHGRHAFAVGSRVTGPNAFVHCSSEAEFGGSEPHHRWSVAGLYDNVQGTILVQNRVNMGSGHGWSGANYVLWNCTGVATCQQPPTAQNYAFGHVGRKEPGHFARNPEAAKAYGINDGHWESYGTRMQPPSLFEQQFIDRLGTAKLGNLSD